MEYYYAIKKRNNQINRKRIPHSYACCIFLILFTFAAERLLASCDAYPSIIAQARQQMEARQYKKALDLFQAAKAACPTKGLEVDGWVNRLFTQIESERDRAIKAEAIADSASKVAYQSAQIATAQQAVADSLRGKAENLSKASTAQALAVKAQQIIDPELRILLALQAYGMHMQAGEDTLQNDVYQALYLALKWGALNQGGIPRSKTLKAHQSSIYAMTFHSDAQLLFTTGSDSKVRAWKWNSIDSHLTPYPLSFPANARTVRRALCLTNDGKHLLITGSQPPYLQVLTWDDSSFQSRPIFTHVSDIQSIHLLPGDQEFLVMSKTQGSWIGSLQSDTLRSHNPELAQFTISKDGSTYASIDKKGQISIGDPSNWKLHFDISAPSGESICLSPDGKQLAIGAESGTIYLWKDVQDSSSSIAELRGQTTRLSDIQFDPSGAYLASSSYDKTIQLWDVQSPDLERRLPLVLEDHQTWVQRICFHPTEPFLIAADRYGQLTIWPIQIEYLSRKVCSIPHRSFRPSEISTYLGENVKPLQPCASFK